MSDQDEELELAAIQRQLDDAFATTRPRPGFDDELWLRMQKSRPAPHRLRAALDGLWRSIRAVPLVPVTAIALIAVLVLGAGLLGRLGPHGGGASTANSAYGPAQNDLSAGTFGRLPTPVLNGEKSATPGGAGGSQQANPAATAALRYTWTGKLSLSIATAPVFRYREPTSGAADQFAAALGAVLQGRPAGFLGAYGASDYTLKVRGTVQSPPSSPAFFILSSTAMPAVNAAGAGPADETDIFLAQHNLTPQWTYTVEVDAGGDPVKVRYDRQFSVSGYGPAYMVDFNGQRYGLEVDLSAGRPVLVSGMLPVTLEEADYRVISADDAVRALLASAPQPAAAAAASPANTVNLNQAELVYVLVPAGDHSFYEPAILFSGTYSVNGQTLTKRVLVPAVDPTQRTP